MVSSWKHSPDPSERPSLPMSGTVMAAVATPSVGMVVYTTGSDCTTTGMVCSWPTLLGILTEGMVWMTWRICWPPAPCVAKMEPGERTWRGILQVFNPAVYLLLQPHYNNGKDICSYHGAYRLYCGGDRCGRQAGLGHDTAGRRVDCGVRRRSREWRGARLVERQVNWFGLVLCRTRLGWRRLRLTTRQLRLHL